MIKREITKEIEKWLGEEKILVLKWPRQVGKTTIMKYFQAELEKKWNKTIYFNADLELWNDIFSSSKKFISFIKTQIWNEKLYIFIDEFQYITNAWLFLKWIFDELKKEIQIIVSGSSSLEITKNSEFLTGRKIDFEIEGISFFEYLNFASNLEYKKYDIDEIYDIGFNLDDIKTHLLDYLNYGSYPEVLVTKDVEKKKVILKEIISTYILKDISGFMKISEIWNFNNLLKTLSFQIWNLLNKSVLWNTINLDYRKLNYFIDILSWTYIINLVLPYFTNVRKEISKMQKVYFNNLSIVKYFTWNYVDSLEVIEWSFIENFIANYLKWYWTLKYYRTISDSEIDFILEKDNKLIPIEVKFRNKVWKLPVVMSNFEKNYEKQVKKHIIITKNELSKNGNVYKIPFYLIDIIKI